MRTEAEDLLGHFEPRTVLKVFTVSSSLREPVLVPVNLWKRHLRYCNRTEAVIDQKKRPAETSSHYVKRPIRAKRHFDLKQPTDSEEEKWPFSDAAQRCNWSG